METSARGEWVRKVEPGNLTVKLLIQNPRYGKSFSTSKFLNQNTITNKSILNSVLPDLETRDDLARHLRIKPPCHPLCTDSHSTPSQNAAFWVFEQKASPAAGELDSTGADSKFGNRTRFRSYRIQVGKINRARVFYAHMLIKHVVSYSLSKSISPTFPNSSVLRRQQFLIRSLGGETDPICRKMAQHVEDVNAKVLEADAENILRAITPALDLNRHKGQAGKIAVVGGCREYTGAPYFSAISALKIIGVWTVGNGKADVVEAMRVLLVAQGADLSHVFCTKDAAQVIKSYSPELIVHPVLEETYSVREEEKESVSRKVLAEVDKWMERFDCLVVGPGLGRDPFLLECVSEIMKHARAANVPIVVDGDGLFLVTNCLDLVSGYPLAVLTPNVNEYRRLVQKVLKCEVNDEEAAEQLISLSKGENFSVIFSHCGTYCLTQYIQSVLMALPDVVVAREIYCLEGGTIFDLSFIISSSWGVALFVSWACQHISGANGSLNTKPGNPAVLGCIAGSALMRKAASLAFHSKKRSTLTTDIIEYLGESLEEIAPAHS
ncbi:unnamed protein product [Rhodiola kirilowii]